MKKIFLSILTIIAVCMTAEAKKEGKTVTYNEKGEIIKFQAGRKDNSGKELSVLFPTDYGFHWAADFGNLPFQTSVSALLHILLIKTAPLS